MSQRKIMVLTGTRADYGLLKPLLREISNDPTLSLSLLVTGSHLSEDFGMTIKEIEADGFSISHRLPILKKDSMVTATAARALEGVGEILNKDRPDIFVVLGDRYESFTATAAATLCNVPVAHLHGGELTLGAVDDALRHAMTKMAWWHFTAADDYRKRVIHLGEAPDRVFNVGATALDALDSSDVPQEELENFLGLKLKAPVVLATLHPETRSPGKAREHVMAVWDALMATKPGTVVFTKANADEEGMIINATLEELFNKQSLENSVLISSLGQRRYLGLLKRADVALGNSSSLVIEAPMVGTPAVNIGRRQDGRVRTAGIIDVAFDVSAIRQAITTAWSAEFKAKTKKAGHPFGTPGVAKRIVDVLKSSPLPTDLAKGFYE